MKTLHILKTEPDKDTRLLIDTLLQGEESSLFKMYDEPVDYEKMIELIFECDKTVSWW
jgi:hypothetical protein